MKKIIIILYIFVALSHTKKSLPPFMYPCKIATRDLDECFLQNGNMLLTNSANGQDDLEIPPLKAVPVADIVPIEFPNANLTLHNVTAIGIENLYIAYTNVDIQKKTIGIYYTWPFITWESAYEAHNNDSDNDGAANIAYNNMGCVTFMNYELNNIDGRDYANITSSNTTFINPDIKIDLDNIEQSPGIEKDFQDNPQYFETNPNVLDTYGNYSSRFLNYLFNSVPFDEIFID